MRGSADDDTTRRSAERQRDLPRELRRKVCAVEDALGHYSLDGDNIQAALEGLRELLDTDKAFLFSLQQRPDGDDLIIARAASVAHPLTSWRPGFEDYLRGRGIAWGGYNAVRPEPGHRNRVLNAADVRALTAERSRETEQVLTKRIGVFGFDTMRVLVCDGPSMLAWVGIMQPDPTTERQRELFELVVHAFRRRLLFERVVGEAAMARSAFAAALEHISGAAWVLDSTRRVAHTNVAGRARFDADATGTRAALDQCVTGEAVPRFKVTPFRDGEGNAGHLVVEVVDRSAVSAALQAAARLGLTPAQTRVLERIVRGASNATIAAELGVAERTVEAHMTAILEKAQVPSRAALIVQILSEGPFG